MDDVSFSRSSKDPDWQRDGRIDAAVVLTIAFPYAAIGPKAVGGAEVICTQVEAAVAPAGFRSVVVAHAASEPQGVLYPTRVPAGPITEATRAEVEAGQQDNIDRALAENSVGLIHMHGLDFSRYRLPAHVPVVVTLHLPPGWYPEAIWSLPLNYHLVCVSESQRRACPDHAQARLTVMENGVEIPPANIVRPAGHYALMLARICPEKNLHAGLDAARLARLPAVLGGEVYPYEEHLRYFAEEIEPRLTTQRIGHESRGDKATQRTSARFAGPVSGAAKQRLLQRAACLLLPSLAPETSSLVAMEALAAGTPVIGMAVGAVPEIVEHGRTGFLIEPGEGAVTAMVAALGRLGEIDRAVCAATAAERFPLRRMVDGYLGLYRRWALPSDQGPVAGEVHRDGGVALPELSEGDPVVDEVRSTGALEALVPEWTKLWQEDSLATPFQHPAWLVPWWRQFGPEGDLHALALRRRVNGGLVGFVPLYVYRDGTEASKLLLLGAGTTDYLDGVWGTGPARSADVCLAQLKDGDVPWACVHLHQLRGGSPLHGAGDRALLDVIATEPCTSIRSTGSLPAKIRTNARRFRRLAEARGPVRCSWATEAAEALTSFDVLVSFHGERWRERGKEGVLRDARVLAHHREALPLLLGAGLLRMFRLALGDETMGVLYALADGPHAADRRLYLYLIGFDSRFAAYSPGTLLVEAAWTHARENGFGKLDLLRGGEAYKRLWGAQTESTWGVEIVRGAGPGVKSAT